MKEHASATLSPGDYGRLALLGQKTLSFSRFGLGYEGPEPNPKWENVPEDFFTLVTESMGVSYWKRKFELGDEFRASFPLELQQLRGI